MELKSGAKIILSIAIGVAALGLLSKATAETIRGNPESCAGLAQTVFVASQYRDQGALWRDIAIELPVMLEEAKGQPGSYVQDAQDVDLVFSLLGQVWNSKRTGEQIANSVFSACISNEPLLIGGVV